MIGASCQSLCTLGRDWRGRWSEMTTCKYFSWGLIINEVHRPLVMFRSNYKVRGCFHDVPAWCLYTPILKPCRVMATMPGNSALELMAGNLTIVLTSVNIGSHSHFVQSAELVAYFSFLCRSEINLCVCVMQFLKKKWKPAGCVRKSQSEPVFFQGFFLTVKKQHKQNTNTNEKNVVIVQMHRKHGVCKR